MEQGNLNPVLLILNWENIDLPSLIKRVAQRFSERAPKHALDIKHTENLPLISGDASLLSRVLHNLLDNAAKYYDSGAPIELVMDEREKAVVIEIRDRGMGISEQDISRIFEPFFRTDRSRSAKVAGTGIGLTLCRRIVEAHNGTISARNRKGGGTAVTLALPVTACVYLASARNFMKPLLIDILKHLPQNGLITFVCNQKLIVQRNLDALILKGQIRGNWSNLGIRIRRQCPRVAAWAGLSRMTLAAWRSSRWGSGRW